MKAVLTLSAVAIFLVLVDIVFASEVYYAFPVHRIEQDGFIRQRRSPQHIGINAKAWNDKAFLGVSADYPIYSTDNAKVNAVASYERWFPGHPSKTQSVSVGVEGDWKSGNHELQAYGHFMQNPSTGSKVEPKFGVKYKYSFGK